MSAEALEDAIDEAVAELPRRKLSGKRLVLFIILPLLVCIGGGVGLVFSGVPASLLGGGEEAAVQGEAEEAIEEGPGIFYDLPEMLVNLNTSDRRQSFLAISVSLELSSAEDLPHIEQVMPRIIDNFQIYLRELRIDDLRGSAGLYRLREELLRRVNDAVRPVRVRDVLFREMLVQ